MPNARITFRQLPKTANFTVGVNPASARYDHYIEFDEPISSFKVFVDNNDALMIINHNAPSSMVQADFDGVKHVDNTATNPVTFTDNTVIHIQADNNDPENCVFDYEGVEIRNLCFVSAHSNDAEIHLEVYK